MSQREHPLDWQQPEPIRFNWKPKRVSFDRFSLKTGSRWFAFAVLPLLFTSVGVYELRTSAIEARVLSAISSELVYKVQKGPSSEIVFPETGPLNTTRGYAQLPAIETRLEASGFHIVEQSVFSRELHRLASWGITPPYTESPIAGLKLRDMNGSVFYDAARRERVFQKYEDIPPLVIQALLLVENRELADTEISTRNPVVDWSRSAKAGLLYAGHKIGLPVPVEGGSTLATQIEKFRYADGGRTKSAGDKLRQMLSASLRVYQSGTDTRGQRRQIVLDYLNSVPLAAAPGYGEVSGLGSGLYAWFGMDLREVREELHAAAPAVSAAGYFKQMLALICSVRAPTFYLNKNREALEARVDFYTHQLENAGAISAEFARAVKSARLEFLSRAPVGPTVPFIDRKGANAIRASLLGLLGTDTLYELDRLDLDTYTTLDRNLQTKALDLFKNLKDPAFVEANGLKQKHLLQRGDPADLTYSFTLFERTPAGNVLRVQADTLNQPFDLNGGMKLELGSTAKLRTLAHYLEIVASLHNQFSNASQALLAETAKNTHDPITAWVAQSIIAQPGIGLQALLDQSLERKYSGNPGEMFFTGGGAHVFANFDEDEDYQFYNLKTGLQHSVNLVYIRLMRDLVRYHQARLPYDPESILNDVANPRRLDMLKEISDKESKYFLFEAYQRYRGLTTDAIVERMLGKQPTERRLAMLYLAWNAQATPETLAEWFAARQQAVTLDEARKLFKSYDPARLHIGDYGYLLDRHPLDVWAAGELSREPNVTWSQLLERSASPIEISSRWLFQPKNARAQNLRLRIRIEEDAFARMLPYWQRLGFPFDRLVPSLATAIGSSADRPAALAELMGIILNDGVRSPVIRTQRLRFAAGTPYETVFEPNRPAAHRVIEPAVAKSLRDVLADVVDGGTAIRMAKAIELEKGKPVVIGGKTGSGDNRPEGGSRGGTQPISRTGTFAFYIGDRYFGVMTAYVAGINATHHGFTSGLSVAALKLLAPALTESLRQAEAREAQPQHTLTASK